jgi:hypothetical protein
MPAALAVPADADVGSWAAPWFNCYNYAIDDPTVLYARPGWGGDYLPGEMNCTELMAAARADGLVDPIGVDALGEPRCEPDAMLIAAMTEDPARAQSDRGVDFHFLRRNADGTWSGKPGRLPATLRCPGGGGLCNPSVAAHRGRYRELCGYLCVPEHPRPTLAAPPDSWVRFNGNAAAFVIGGAGGALPRSFELDAAQFERLLRRFPTGQTTLGPATSAPLDGFGLMYVHEEIVTTLFVSGAAVGVYSHVLGAEPVPDWFADDRDLGTELGLIIASELNRSEQSICSKPLGDLDIDGNTGPSDLDRLTLHLVLAAIGTTHAIPLAVDVDCDGDMDALDATVAVQRALGSPQDPLDGDADGCLDRCGPRLCDDGDACTYDGIRGGRCDHAPRLCMDADDCTEDRCTPDSGCTYAPIPGCVSHSKSWKLTPNPTSTGSVWSRPGKS